MTPEQALWNDILDAVEENRKTEIKIKESKRLRINDIAKIWNEMEQYTKREDTKNKEQTKYSLLVQTEKREDKPTRGKEIENVSTRKWSVTQSKRQC